jgi:hypothetical protein
VLGLRGHSESMRQLIILKVLGMVMPTYKPDTWKAEAGGSQVQGPAAE